MDRLPNFLEPWFIFSLIWSVGATCDNDGRKKFSEWLKNRMEQEKLKLLLPNEGLVYDYFVDDGGVFNAEDENRNDDEPIKYRDVNFNKKIKKNYFFYYQFIHLFILF